MASIKDYNKLWKLFFVGGLYLAASDKTDMFTAAMQTVQKQTFLKSVKNSYIRNSQKPIAISVNTDKVIAISVNKINTIAISVIISFFY